MASVVYFGLALFFLTSFVIRVDSNLKRYVSVVSDIHEHYKTSSVFFVLSRNNRSLEDYTALQSLSHGFSRKYDFTSIIHLDQLEQSNKWYQKRIGLSLLVIFVQSLSDIDEFTKTSVSRSSIWLVIFTNESGSSAICEYCKSPKENSVRLRFDTEMLVICCDSLVLKEWWSINGKHIEVSDFASWSDENRAKSIFLAPSSLDVRRFDLKGAGIRIGLLANCIFAYKVGDEIRGPFGDIVAELKNSMNFTITGTVESSGYGKWNSKTNNWTGVVGRLVQGDADLGAADFIVVKERLKVLDYTLPLLVANYKLYIRDEPESVDVNWQSYFEVFSVGVWIATIIIIILASMVLALIKRFRSSRSLPSLIDESYLQVWGILCQQGLSEFPVETSLRLAYMSVFVLALVIYAAYGASLTSVFTVTSSAAPFTTLEGFVDDGSYRLVVYKNNAEFEFIANSTAPVLKRMMQLMKPIEELPETVEAGWKQVCNERVALFTIHLSANDECKVMAIDSDYAETLSMTMPAGSQYSRAINYHIQRFKDAGLIDRIYHKYGNTTPAIGVVSFDEVQIWDVAAVLTIVIIGVILALTILLSEIMYHAFKTNSRNRRRGKNSQDMWKRPAVIKLYPRRQPLYGGIAVDRWIMQRNNYK